MMRFGVHEQYQDGPNRTTPNESKQRYPLLMVTREFKGGVIKPQNLIPSLNNLCKATWDAGLTCNVSFKFSRAEVLDGKWRVYIDQAVNWLRDNERTAQTIVTIWHEPEDDASDSFRDGRAKEFESGIDFVEYFDTVHNWIKEIDPNLLTSHAALGYGYRPAVGGTNDKSAWVADPANWVTKADIHAVDLYSGRSFPLDVTLGSSTAFKRWLDSRPGNSAWGVSERGWITGKYGQSAERVASINAEFDWLMTLPLSALPEFYIVWNTEGTENDPQIILDDYAIAAVNEGFSRLDQKIKLGSAPPVEPTPEPVPSASTKVCPTCNGNGEIPSSYTVSTTITAGCGNG